MLCEKNRRAKESNVPVQSTVHCSIYVRHHFACGNDRSRVLIKLSVRYLTAAVKYRVYFAVSAASEVKAWDERPLFNFIITKFNIWGRWDTYIGDRQTNIHSERTDRVFISSLLEAQSTNHMKTMYWKNI